MSNQPKPLCGLPRFRGSVSSWHGSLDIWQHDNGEIMSGPRVLLLSDVRGWAFDQQLHDLIRYLGERADFTIDYVAEWFVNGESVGELPHWEDGSFEITDLARPGEAVRVSVLLQKTKRLQQFGIYGDVRLTAVPRASVQGLFIDPRLTADDPGAGVVSLLPEPQLRLSCNVFNPGPAAHAVLAFTIEAADSSGTEKSKQFRHAFTLVHADSSRDVIAAAQTIVCSFPWPDPVLWAYDTPFLYRIRAELLLDGRQVDVAPWISFGFREFRTHGADFLLNGVPTHLRGHQIDLAWGPQMPKVEELRAAGMNSFEFHGPVSSKWYKDRPCFPPDFDRILTYADANGLIAATSLPGATVLRDTLFDSNVGERYQRRIASFVRRYGNHPSVCLWHTHFNWAGYRWYHPPDKTDGSYKPDNPTFRDKERLALQAEGLIHTVDQRPVLSKRLLMAKASAWLTVFVFSSGRNCAEN